jgi:hypothetical protein
MSYKISPAVFAVMCHISYDKLSSVLIFPVE